MPSSDRSHVARIVLFASQIKSSLTRQFLTAVRFFFVPPDWAAEFLSQNPFSSWKPWPTVPEFLNLRGVVNAEGEVILTAVAHQLLEFPLVLGHEGAAQDKSTKETNMT